MYELKIGPWRPKKIKVGLHNDNTGFVGEREMTIYPLTAVLRMRTGDNGWYVTVTPEHARRIRDEIDSWLANKARTEFVPEPPRPPDARIVAGPLDNAIVGNDGSKLVVRVRGAGTLDPSTLDNYVLATHAAGGRSFVWKDFAEEHYAWTPGTVTLTEALNGADVF